MAEKEQEREPVEEQSTEVTELSDENLEDASGGAPLDDVNNSSCNGNCGC
jgi:hypothetical protein